MAATKDDGADGAGAASLVGGKRGNEDVARRAGGGGGKTSGVADSGSDSSGEDTASGVLLISDPARTRMRIVADGAIVYNQKTV